MTGNALVSFQGKTVDGSIAALVADPRAAGVMLYGPLNVDNAEQTRALIDELVRAAGRPLLVAIDQEGGQLLAAGPETTPFAGNMALGATGDAALARRVAGAIGRELRSLGINIDLAPVADIATRPYNPSMGIRSFGEVPSSVSELTAAFVAGIQVEGVAATLKHFPGKGEASVDPHYELPILDLDRARLDRVEFAPFRSGFQAGAHLLMVGHYGLPAVTGDRALPTSMSSEVMKDLVRGELGFSGVIVTDALDMGGFGQHPPDGPLGAGADLLLYGPAQAGQLPTVPPGPSAFVERLLDWVASFDHPDVTVVGCEDHRQVAGELAEKSITLVRDESHLLPLRLSADDRLLAIMPRPQNLTPADMSEGVPPLLADAVRKKHRSTTEYIPDHDPSDSQITDAVRLAKEHDLVVIGTLDASPEQAELVTRVVGTGTPTVTVAMRTPYDLAAYPEAKTYLCSYGILEPTVTALVGAMFGAPITGHLPVAVPGLYPVGHGIVTEGSA
jgi:beta-N-acetylhexosaminidase